jgi:malonyl-CoA O-methyltransferase
MIVDQSRREDTRTKAVARAIAWVKKNRLADNGIPPHPGAPRATQEVTGYFIPTLYDCGEPALARDLARWEASVQRADGAFVAVDGVPYTFDTAQAMRGLLRALDDIPALKDNLARAARFVASQIDADGRIHTPAYGQWLCEDGSTFSEYANLYVLPPLRAAGEKLGDGRLIDTVSRSIAYFKAHSDLVEFKPELGTLSHIFGYMMEALTQLGEYELARRGLQQAAAVQTSDGAVPAYPGATWVCSTGVAQLALAWYGVGESDRADAALDYLCRIQNASGGFYGGYGPGAAYFPDAEISWAIKFFLDGCAVSRKHSADAAYKP